MQYEMMVENFGEDILNTSRNQIICKNHNDKQIEFYCNKDDLFMCSKCTPQHDDHSNFVKYFNLDELLDSIKAAQKDF